MLTTILNWISGGLLDKGLEAMRLWLNSRTQQAVLDQGVTIEELRNAREAARNARDIRIATSGFWEMRLITVLIALPFVVHLLLVGADTCFRLGWGVPAFPPPFDEWEGAILQSFFGVTAVGVLGKSIAGAIAYRR